MSELLPYELICRASKGESDAVYEVLKHFDAYINKLSTRTIASANGNIRYVFDEDIKHELQIELIVKIQAFNCEEDEMPDQIQEQ